MPTDATTADLLSRALRAQGARRVFRAPDSLLPSLPGLVEVPVPSAELAVLLADADGRLVTGAGAGPGVAFVGERRLHLGSRPGATADQLDVVDPYALPHAVAGWALGEVFAAVELDLRLDLQAPPPAGVEPVALATATDRLVTLSPTLAGFRTVLVVGPGVVRAGEVGGVAEAATHTGAGVVATMGAVGALDPGHPAWFGVVGLQAGDPALSGLAEAELVITAGVDPAELGGAVPSSAQVLEIEPWHLAFMARHWTEPAGTPHGSALVDALAPVGRGRPAPHPRAVAAEALGAVGPEGVLAADGGVVGLWLTRGLAPCAGRVVVPSTPAPGFAAAAAVIGALDGRPTVAVVAGPADPATDRLIDLAAGMGLEVVVEEWLAPGEGEAPPEVVGSVVVRHRSVDLDATAELVSAAGPVVAWGGAA